ncbi:MAG: hypothetical protein ACRCWQ_14075, partial [Bacilli bacterium]
MKVYHLSVYFSDVWRKLQYVSTISFGVVLCILLDFRQSLESRPTLFSYIQGGVTFITLCILLSVPIYYVIRKIDTLLFPLIVADPKGFLYRGERISWNEITNIRLVKWFNVIEIVRKDGNVYRIRTFGK